jgi:hypothetical protein
MNLNMTDANQIPLNANQLDETNMDFTIMNDDTIPGPVKQMWSSLRTKELYLIQQNKLNTVYINDYQQRDLNNELVNYINYTWQTLQIYKLPLKIIMMFRYKLSSLSKLIKY